MKRLTTWTSMDGKAKLIVTDGTLSDKLIEQIAIQRLAEYEDAEEQGLLVRLPCKVGDTVWFISPLASKKEITETIVEKIVVKEKGVYMKLACNVLYETSCKSIGKTVFFTHEAAEKALEDA